MKATDENNNKTGERFSQAQQYILQLYNCHEMLIIFILHVFFKNLRLYTIGSYII
jgi:hypothetical protein